MVGVLTPEQQNRSRQITKLESGFDALNASKGFAYTLFYYHPKVHGCSQSIQSTNTKFSGTDIISGGVKNYMCLLKIKRAYQTRVVEVDAEPERAPPEKKYRLVAKLRGIAGRGL